MMGSHLTKHFLSKGFRVTVLNTYSDLAEKNLEEVRDQIEVVWGSVTDEEIVDKTVRGHDVVIHLAARIHVDESIEDPLGAVKVNIFGTHNLLMAAKKHNCFMIHGSSCEVYGEPENLKIGIHEGSEMRPKSPYSASKAGADRLCFAYHATYGIPVVIVRPFNVYGEGQKESGFGSLIAMAVKRAIDKKPLYVYGSGRQKRDYMNIDDLVAGYDLAVRKRKILNGHSINIATGKSTSVGAIVKYIAKKMGAKIEYKAARAGEVKDFPADISKAKKLGFEPKVSIWKGIDRYIEWRVGQLKK